MKEGFRPVLEIVAVFLHQFSGVLEIRSEQNLRPGLHAHQTDTPYSAHFARSICTLTCFSSGPGNTLGLTIAPSAESRLRTYPKTLVCLHVT